MLWRMWKGAQRCLRRVVTVESFYLIQTLSAVACSIYPWNRFTVVIQSFHLCETIVSRRWKDLFTNVKWSDHVVLAILSLGGIYIQENYPHDLSADPVFEVVTLCLSKTRTSFEKHVRVSEKLVRVFLKAKTMPILIKKVVSLQPEDRVPRLIILLFIINHWNL